MINDPVDEEYYTIKEVAALLKVVYLTVYRWVQAGKIVTYKVQKQYRIKKTDLNKFLNDNKYGKSHD
ncbi:MAG: helix-turn-helix domain-containing protein [Patescibacteria group bacterium]